MILSLRTGSDATDAEIPNRPVVDITTTTDSINTNLTLIPVDARTKERPSSGGAYEITTRRSRHAPVRLEAVDAPVDSTLRLFLKNMRGPLEIYLHPMCQGKFSFEAVIAETLGLGIRGYTENPSGNDRKRNLVWGGWSIPPGIKRVLSGEVRLKTIVSRPLVFSHVSDQNIVPHP